MPLVVETRYVKLDKHTLKVLETEAEVNGRAEMVVPTEPVTVNKRRYFFVKVVAVHENGVVRVYDYPVPL